ncbi:hypothetical protein ACFQYP_49185 [Nonomuraea antimicrobica]
MFEREQVLAEGGVGQGERPAGLERGGQRQVEAAPGEVVADERVGGGGLRCRRGGYWQDGVSGPRYQP